MEQLSAAAFAISLFGGFYDLLTKRIPNWLTFPAMLAGLAAQFWIGGLAGALDGAGGVLLGFGLFLPVYLLGYMGAGDVKLLMAIGAWMGWRAGLNVAVCSVVIGATYALGEIIWRGRLVPVFRASYSFLRSLLVPGLVPEKLRLDENRKFAFGLCLAGGVAMVIYLRHRGGWL